MSPRSALPWVGAAVGVAGMLWFAGIPWRNLPHVALSPTDGALGVRQVDPIDEQTREKRGRPESVSAAELVDALTDIRYALARDAPASRALIDEIGAHSRKLRLVRREPDAVPWASVASETEEVLRRVAASPWGRDPAIVAAVDRSRVALRGEEP